MTEAKKAWDDVVSEFSGLGLKLKLHLEQARGDKDEPAGKDVNAALKKLAEAIDDAFDAVGTAAKDSAVRNDIKGVGKSLSSALGATFAEVSEDLSKAFKSKSSPEERSAPPAE